MAARGPHVGTGAGLDKTRRRGGADGHVVARDGEGQPRETALQIQTRTVHEPEAALAVQFEVERHGGDRPATFEDLEDVLGDILDGIVEKRMRRVKVMGENEKESSSFPRRRGGVRCFWK